MDLVEKLEATGGIWSPNYLPVTLANLTIVAIAAFDGLALVAALPSIADDLGGVALLPWVITAYLATSAVAGIMAGPIIDAVGVRRTFRATGVWFLFASAAAAAAPNMELLVAARALQGIGGGLVISVALTAVGLAYPQRLRARAFAANSMVWGTLGFGGPVITAGLLAVAGWRMIFVIQLPITALALAAGWRTLPSTRNKPQRIVMDGRGIALIVGLVAASLFAVAQVGVRWPLAAVGAAAAIAFGRAFWTNSGRTDGPLVSRIHITRFPLKRIHLTAGLVLIAGLAADNYLPLYMQTTRGRSESFAAFSVLFLTVGWSSAAFLVSRLLERWRETDAILLGSILMIPAVIWAGVGVALTWPIPVIFGAFYVMGAAIGFVSTAGLTLLQASADDSEMGRVNSAHQFIRTIGITYGVAVGGAILLFVVGHRIGDVEVVRDVLGGEDVVASGPTLDAIRDGLVWVLVFSGVAALGCLAAAMALWRNTRGLPLPVVGPGGGVSADAEPLSN
ncbi:MFS transporter [Ilumatobacter sp.]|uniref:MFS transporter n=1 Tax=Ilumatobacter sp. TaxID=1967498 RepID=UPI003752B11F